MKMTEISKSQDYLSFRSTIPQKKMAVDDDCNKEWTIYDAGPRSVKCPIVCMPPASGTADVFYRQLLSLTALGYRVIAVNYPVYWSLKEFCEGFRRLIDHLQLDKVHIFGASLGGFLGQKFTESTWKSSRVASLILCNTFSDTNIFQNTNSAPTFWLMPGIVLKKMVMGNFDRTTGDADITDSVEFMANRLDTMSQGELASRLKLNCMNSYIEPQRLRSTDITIIDVFDESALSDEVKEEMYKCYPDARRAHMKTGGNFPYLSRADETNLYIQIHLRQFEGTKLTAKEEALDVEETEEAL